MENLTIEKMEIKRFNALLVRTIAGMLLFGVLVWSTYLLDTDGGNSLGLWLVFSNLLFMVVAWRASTILEKIKKDKKLHGALDNDIYSDYNHKAIATGFYATLISGLLLFFIGGLLDIPMRTACVIILFTTLFASEIRRLLLYNPYKDGK